MGFWQVRPCSTQDWPLPGLKTGEVTQSPDAHTFHKGSTSKDRQILRTKIDHAIVPIAHQLWWSWRKMVNSGWSSTINNWTSKQLNLAGHCLLLKEFFYTLEGSCYFSTADMSWGLYQLSLEMSGQDYTPFSTPFGSFKLLVMPMGLTGSPPVFLSLMEKVLVGLTWKSTIPLLRCLHYLFSNCWRTHWEISRDLPMVQRGEFKNQFA